MPKYQIILSSDLQIPNDEFEKMIIDAIECQECGFFKNFKLYYAQNLEGIKRELWEKPESEIEVEEPETKSIQDLFKPFV